MSSIKVWFKNFKLKEKWGELVVATSPITFSVMFGFSKIGEYLGIRWFVILVIFFSILTLSGLISNIINSESISKLLDQNLKLRDQKEHIEGVLGSLPEESCKLLSNKWGLHGDSRITIYRYNSEHFFPVSRHSKNPDYDSINRSTYPRNVGYINKCWMTKEGEYFNNLPDPKLNEKEYIDYVSKDSGMLKKDLRDLSMKSRSYYGKTLYDANGQAFLIVMIESIYPCINNIDEIKQDLGGTMSEFIVSIVGSNITPGGGEINE